MKGGITDFFHVVSRVLTYDKGLPISEVTISKQKQLNRWHAEPLLLTMVLIEYHLYES